MCVSSDRQKMLRLLLHGDAGGFVVVIFGFREDEHQMTFQRLASQHTCPQQPLPGEQRGFIPQTWLRLLHRDYSTLQWYMPCLLCFLASSAGNFSFFPRVLVLETFCWQNSLSISAHRHGPGTCLPWDSPHVRMSGSHGFVPWGSLTLVSAQTNSSLPPSQAARPSAETHWIWKPGADTPELSKSTQTMSPVTLATLCSGIDRYLYY